ncbi:MAG: hypothetical protein DHS20C21_17990 [Gemmatimonadota bacterium]|nr:MAG: hypothetical protein DHS20C21_17990 [Gemmatimonadota bacterium]
MLALAGLVCGWRLAAIASSTGTPPQEAPPGWISDGRPTLLVVGRSTCAACRRAFADLRSDEDLRAAGVRIEANDRVSTNDRLEWGAAAKEWYRSIGAGPVPAYVLLDANGAPLAMHRGYLLPHDLRDWVTSTLLQSHAFP